MCALVTGVQTCALPSSDLYDDKHEAVRSALGTKDLLLVEGPPGTGKTKFITELVAQVLSRTPDARILLSSQTNVALDHALVNIEKLAKIGRASCRERGCQYV